MVGYAHPTLLLLLQQHRLNSSDGGTRFIIPPYGGL